ncbi:hypothetical protein KUCAC02_018090 [Chaenocephalus aceratus]|uniref:Uncharacterized protein n=1 Tax=Chaenocephalus aceratus TaxID=36190 RepID=A0ACB9W898_CHAAC|nr:hypothetical protein KUCAC02_018090 [Chaenocephalus aceratus]
MLGGIFKDVLVTVTLLFLTQTWSQCRAEVDFSLVTLPDWRENAEYGTQCSYDGHNNQMCDWTQLRTEDVTVLESGPLVLEGEAYLEFWDSWRQVFVPLNIIEPGTQVVIEAVSTEGQFIFNHLGVRRGSCGQQCDSNTEFWTDESTRCLCSGGQLSCSPTQCPKGQICGPRVERTSGIHASGMCTIHSHTDCSTFDGVLFRFMASCTYTLVKTCSPSETLPLFSVEVVNEKNWNSYLPTVQEVIVDMGNFRVSLLKRQTHRIVVNGVWKKLPLSLNNGSVKVKSNPAAVELETSFGLSVSYDNAVPHQCDPLEEAEYASELYCGGLLSSTGPFAGCLSVLGAESYFRACVVGMCSTHGGWSHHTHIEELYTMPPSVGENSHYNSCADGCPEMCSGLDAVGSCGSCEERASATMALNSEGKCVAAEDCGCWDNGKHYEKGASFSKGECEQQCQCVGTNEVNKSGVKLPYSTNGSYGSVWVYLKNNYIILETTFGLRMIIDAQNRLFLHVDERYKYELCGLCGTFSDCQEDDFVTPGGQHGTCPFEFGDSWKVPGNNECISHPDDPRQCDVDEENEAYNECYILLGDAFKPCHETIHPSIYLSNCAYDFCATRGDRHTLCESLKSYAAACHVAGVELPHWQTDTACLCPINCDFENNLCGWEQLMQDSFDWTRHSGPTPSSLTGPNQDHTTGGVSGPFQILLEGIRGSDAQSYVAIDDISINFGSCLGSVPGLMWKSSPHTQSAIWTVAFDRSLCSWSHMITGAFYWTWQRGSTPTLMTGPSADHTGDGHYLYIEASSVTHGDTARLISSECSDSGQTNRSCLVKTNEQGYMWQMAQVDIRTTRAFKIIIEGRRGSNEKSDLAIDDVKLYRGRCSDLSDEKSTSPSKPDGSPVVAATTDFNKDNVTQAPDNRHPVCQLNCNYEQDLCQWTQLYTDVIDWTRHSGSTPTIMTGPSSDHTTGGGHYLYIEANSASHGDTARLISSECSDSGPQCLQFWYHMYGSADTMGLHVYLLQDILADAVWWKRNDHGNMWHLAQVDLATYGAFQVIIEGQIGSNDQSDVAIDDVSLHRGHCRDLAQPTTPALTTSNQVATEGSPQPTTTATPPSTTTARPQPPVKPVPTPSCPENSHYTTCVPACSPTCTHLNGPPRCTEDEGCVQGCVCDEGFVQKKRVCVPIEQCGCVERNGTKYDFSDVWYTSHCSQKCECEKDYGVGWIDCDDKDECDGKAVCLQIMRAIITASLQASTNNLPNNLPHVYIEGITKNMRLVVDGRRTKIPTSPTAGLKIRELCSRISLKTDFGLSVEFDGHGRAGIILPRIYKRKVGGLCGNFDGKKKNDMMKPDGTRAKNVQEFGESWSVKDWWTSG